MAKKKTSIRKVASRRARTRSKSQERRIARWCGGVRTPLSGGNSRHTRGDVIHSSLYGEFKGAKGASGTTGWIYKLAHLDLNRTYLIEGEEREPVPNLYLVHSSRIGYAWFTDVPVSFAPARRFIQHWKEVADIAADERKIAFCTFSIYRKRGWWVMASYDNMLSLEREVARAASK